MKKEIMIALFAFGMMTACKNETKSGETNTEIAAETLPSGEQESQEATNPMAIYAGTWKQEVASEIPNLTDVKQLASIEVTLNEDGTFEGSQKLMNNSVSMKGTWKVNEDVVELNWNGELLHLKADQNQKTLTDAKEGVVLEKQ